MVTMFKPKPQLLRVVDKPDNVSSQEIAKSRPVYIDGLPEGGGGGGASTSDAITMAGLPDEAEVNGMTLNEFLWNFSEVVKDLSTHTSETITIKGLDNSVDGMTLNDYLGSINDGIQSLVGGLIERIEALESEVEPPTVH